MFDDTLSEGGRLVIGILFTLAVIAACKWWPSRKGKKNER